MTALRSSAVYLAGLSGVLGLAIIAGAARALAIKAETGVFLLGLTAGMGLWACGLFLVAAAGELARIAARLDELTATAVEGQR